MGKHSITRHSAGWSLVIDNVPVGLYATREAARRRLSEIVNPEKVTVSEAQAALDAAWEKHQAALNSGSQRKINAAAFAIDTAVSALRVAKNHEAFERDFAKRKAQEGK